MRIAPGGLLPIEADQAYELGCDLAALTHGHPAGYVTAGAMALIINRLMEGATLESAVGAAIDVVDQEKPTARVCAGLMRQALDLAGSERPSHRVVARLGEG